VILPVPGATAEIEEDRWMRLGIVVAMLDEAKTLTKHPLGIGQTIEVHEEVLVHLSGVGRKRAARAAQFLLNRGATALLSWGTAGGLVPGLAPGSLVLPKTVMGSDSSLFQVDASWQERLRSRLEGRMGLCSETLIESPTVLMTPEAKRALADRTGAVAVDMESAAVAFTAKQAGLPFVALRVISDTLDQTLPSCVLSAYDTSGHLRMWGLLRGLVRHPQELLGWMRLTTSLRKARKTLTGIARLTEWDFLAPQ
jgi:adenosylhomocysteine nucleosidase